MRLPWEIAYPIGLMLVAVGVVVAVVGCEHDRIGTAIIGNAITLSALVVWGAPRRWWRQMVKRNKEQLRDTD